MYIEWTKDKLEDYLKDKVERSVSINEYLLLTEFINKIRPTTLIDIGTYLGASGYILGTCCETIQQIYSIDNIDSLDYTPKPEAPIEEHGKYLSKDAIFLREGYENGVLESLIKNRNEFVFWDAGKNFNKVMRQIELSYKLKIKYIAIHDTNVSTVRRAIRKVEKLKWYKICEEELSNQEKGVSVMELC
jgi:predicted O-methyltransferase YrrM